MNKFALTCSSVLALAILFSAPVASAQSSAPPAKPSTPPPAAASKQQAPAANAAPPSNPQFRDQKEKVSYALGLSLGISLRRQDLDVDTATLMRGMNDGISGAQALMTEDEVRATVAQMQNDLRAKQEEKARMAAVNNKKEGEEFLEANKTKEGVVALPSGLQYKVISQGTGPTPLATDTVVCNYRGTLINGVEFDSSYKRGQPATFQVNRVIRGWTEALQLMPAGSKWQLFIPSTLAYGDRGAGPDIGPNATLIFEVELVSVQPKPQPGQLAPPKPAPATPPNPTKP